MVWPFIIIVLFGVSPCLGFADSDLEQRLITALVRLNEDTEHSIRLMVSNETEDATKTFAIIPRDDDTLGVAIIFPIKLANGTCGMKSKYYVNSSVKYVALPPMGQSNTLYVRCLALTKCGENFKDFWCIYNLEGQAIAEMKHIIQRYLNYTETLTKEIFSEVLDGVDPDFKGLVSLGLSLDDESHDDKNGTSEGNIDGKEEINIVVLSVTFFFLSLGAGYVVYTQCLKKRFDRGVPAHRLPVAQEVDDAPRENVRQRRPAGMEPIIRPVQGMEPVIRPVQDERNHHGRDFDPDEERGIEPRLLHDMLVQAGFDPEIWLENVPEVRIEEAVPIEPEPIRRAPTGQVTSPSPISYLEQDSANQSPVHGSPTGRRSAFSIDMNYGEH